jgi:hypothetical protein
MRAFAYKFFLVFCATAFGLGVIAVLRVIAVPVVIGLLVDSEQKMVDLKRLRELGELQTVPVSQVLNKPAELVCVLGVYQLEVWEDGPFRDRVNALLKNANFGIFGEGTWFFVVVHDDSATVQKIYEHRDQLYLARAGAGLPDTFKPVECTTVDRARVMKVRESMISLGEER